LKIGGNGSLNKKIASSYGIKSIGSGKRIAAFIFFDLKNEKTKYIGTIKTMTDFELCKTKDIFASSITPEQIFLAFKDLRDIIGLIYIDNSNKDFLINYSLGAVSSYFFQDVSWKYEAPKQQLAEGNHHGIIIDQSIDIDQVSNNNNKERIIVIFLYAYIHILYLIFIIIVRCSYQNI
jgi:hypothetical protein